MAITHKQAMMVLHPEGTTKSTLAPQTSACSLFVVLQQLNPVGGSQDIHTLLVKKESSPVGKSTTGSSSTIFNKMSFNKMPLASVAATDTSSQESNFPAEATCNDITVTLDNNNMWNEFFRCQTEMILTKQGRRMFPYCRFRVSGLEPFQRYMLVMDMHPVDNYRYKWSDRQWETNGKAEPHSPSSFVHPDSPATGFDWMQNPVSFYKLKLTNNHSDKEGNISINSMHRYLPRLHIIPADKVVDLVQLNEPDVTTFNFPQTEFFAVTAYQNLSITQLKIDYNPFAKGFREDANNSRSGKPKNGPSTEKLESEARSSQNTTLNNLKSLFAKRNAVDKVPANGDLKTVHGNSLMDSEPERNSSNRKRPWPEGLSELIKNAHVKVQRISSEKVPDVNDQQNNTCLETGTVDCKSENLSDDAFASSPDTNVINRTITNVTNHSITEKPVAMFESTDSSMINTTNKQCNYSEQTSSTPINEIVATTLNETSVPAENDNSKETSQSAGKPLDCGDKVKKKRAEPVPLPLLALFLQQLKSKTRPSRSVSKSETCSSSSHTNESCNTTSDSDPTIALPIIPNALADTAQSSASEAVCATTPDASLNEPEHSNVPTYESTHEPDMNSSTVVFPERAPETIAQPLSSDVTMSSSLHDPLSPDESPPSSAPSSPDPFPPSMFSDRPIPRRKVLNPFPSYLSSTRPSPLIVLPDPLPGSFLNRSRDSEECIPAVYSVRCEETSPVIPPDTSKKLKQSLHTTTNIKPKVTEDTAAVPAMDLSKDTVPSIVSVSMEAVTHVVSPDTCIPMEIKKSIQDITSPQLQAKHVEDEKSKLGEDTEVTEDTLPFTTKEPSGDTTASVNGMKVICPVISEQSTSLKSEVIHNTCGTSQLSQDTDVMEDPIHLQCVLLTEERAPVVHCVNKEVTSNAVISFVSDIPTTIKQPSKNIAGKRNKLKHRQGAKPKISEDTILMEGPTAVPLQPSLEDVEGQLFVSFKSKKALKIHLGDQAGERVLQQKSGNAEGEVTPDVKKRINALEKHLLGDLKIMRHRQVIHPVLQAVGLKLNLLNHSLAIDLQYLGVCLPIPLPAVLPDESSGSCSSQFSFVSRTGKTTDLTKIKGWKDKFATTNSSSFPGDAGQKNLSAFCSDMLDEYLESEGRLIDERVTSFSQASQFSPVAYEMPTKSTSYVRTLDSVLKKQTPPADTFKSSTATKSTPKKWKNKKVVMSQEKSKKSAAKKPSDNKDKQLATNVKESSLKKSARSATKSASSESSAGYSLSQNEESDKIKTKTGSKTSQASAQLIEKPVEGSSSVAPLVQNSSSTHGSSLAGGRRLMLNKTLVKLMDIEDGAVWEGRHRTYITEERAAIALSCLITAEGPMEKSSSTIIKRRAPPCLNDFCRLGCVCASLSHQRRQHHCHKFQCMLRCNCLRHKVLLKSPATDKVSNDLPLQLNNSKKKEKKLKKSKKRMSYILFEPEGAPEPAAHVKKLWDQNCDSDSDRLFSPSTTRPLDLPLLSPEQQQNVESISHPVLSKIEKDLRIVEDQESWQDCARVRPFYWKKLSSRQTGMKDDSSKLSSHHLLQEKEEGRPSTQSGSAKRLEIVSKCSLATEGNTENILHTLCEHMTQDRLDHPFWIGKFQIKLISKTLSKETKEGSTITYRVAICQPKLKESEEQIMDKRTKQLEAQLINTIGKSKVKGLPLLSMVTPAGLLQAKKKTPGASGQILVNGKPYPQAKLELGKMGALHPANRLAAYITGRACPANKPATKVLVTAAPTPITTTPTSVPTTTSVTTTLSSTVISVVPTVTKPLLGADFAQAVFNQVNSQQPKLPSESTPPLQNQIKNIINPPSLVTGATVVSVSPTTTPKAIIDAGSSSVNTGAKSSLGTDNAQIVINSQKQTLPGSSAPLLQSTIKKVIIPSSSAMNMATGVSVSSSISPKTNMVSQPSALPVTKVIKVIIPKSGSAKPKDTATVCATGPSGALPSAGVRLMQPVNLSTPPVPGQKMMAFKAANGNFLCRDSSGKLIQLMPLSQFKALKPNFVMPKQSYVIRLPTPNTVPLSKPGSTAFTTVTSPTPSSAMPQVQNLPSIHRTATENVTSTITSTVATKPVTSLSGSSCLLFTSQPGTVKILPKFLSNTDTSTVRIVPQNDETTKVVQDFKIINSTASDQSSLDVLPDQGFIQLAPQSCITQESQDVQKSDDSIQISSISSEEQNIKPFHCSKSSNEVVFADHSYTHETKTTTSPEKTADMKVSSAYNTLKQESLEMVPIKQEQETNVKYVVLGTESGGGGNTGSYIEQVEIKSECSELTEDSEMYDETETAEFSAEEDLCHTVTGSNREKINIERQDSLDDELVDIETIKEGPKEFTTTLEMTRQVSHQDDSSSEESENEKSDIMKFRRQKVKKERKRRSALKNSFDKLMQTLYVEDPKIPNIKLLKLALKEIRSLNQQRDDLQKMQNKMQEKRSHFLDKASRLSGKSEESIHKKLNELIAKGKSLGIEDKSNYVSLPKSTPRDQNFTQADLSISTQKSVQSQQIRKDDSLGPTQSASTLSVMNSSTFNPTTQLQNNLPLAKPVEAQRERTRPNILSRRIPETKVSEQVIVPQVIPLGITSNPIIPSSQIILINNPIQPINNQPTTPGVAAVSISVPYFAHPIRVENPHVFQPQVKPTDSPLNSTTPVKNLNLPKIARVVSLVAPKDPVNPSSAVLQNTEIPVGDQTQTTSNPAPIQAQQNAPFIEAHLDQLPSNVVPKKLEQSTVDALTKPKEGSSTPNSEQENESLMSLLDELVFLNQQMNNETLKPEEEPQRSTEAKDPMTSQLTEKDVNLDECSLSPLFLKLDEDLTSISKDEETSNIPSKVNEHDFPCNLIQSEPAESSSNFQVPACNVKPNPSPPPLLQMKVGGTTSMDSMKNQANVSWRPMPKLAPLGLKTLEAGKPKATSLHVHKTH
ncbi:MAX dimerization protein MGA a [Trichomycterus rosablanca]|uniref:MAX dimerization protein MGA a n=1 Tax=Trichomycterus rosablanca TaxID=2290929 RepID=UPI002F358AFE